ncbi:MAG TPA: AAA family ATPase [Acidimicrobiia bacterium]
MPGRVSSPHLIGRAAELVRLDELFTAADENAQAGVYLLGGEAGVGKSRLVGEYVARTEQRGGTALIGGCLELVDRALPYAPVVEALRQLVRRLDPAELDNVIGPARRELAHLLPELDRDGQGGDDDELSQRRLFEHVLGVLERLGEQSTAVFVIEDLHWADRSTLDLLVFLARNLRDVRTVIVATYRSDELHRRHPLRPVLAELDRSGRVERHELARLSRGELAELVTAIRGVEADAELVDEILARSEGNAFFAEELLAAGAAGGALPPTLRDLLLARIDALSDGARVILQVAAVIGARVPHSFLEAVVSSEGKCLDHEALRESVEQHVLVADDAGYRFRHALVQEAVYDDLLPGERAEMHERVATVLSTRPELLEARTADVEAELACHWYSAHDLPNALRAAVRAAEGARQMYAFPEALAHLERALELWERVPDASELVEASFVEIVRRTASAAELSGRTDRALALAERALAAIDPHDDPVTAALVHERIARYMWMNRRPFDDVIAHNEAAARLVPEQPPSRERALVEAAFGQALMVHDRNEEALGWCDAAITTARTVGDRVVEGHARNTRGSALAHQGALEDGLAELYLSLDIARDNGSWPDVSRAYVNISGALEGANRFEEALAVAQAGLTEVEMHGLSQCDSVFLRTHLAEALFELGRWDEVDDELRDISQMDAIGIDALHRDDAWFRLLLHRGDIAGAQAVFTRMADYVTSGGARQLSPYFEGSLAIARGDVAVAVALLEKWRAEFDDRDCSLLEEPDWFISEVLTATVDAGAGRPETIAQAEALVIALDETLPTDPRLDAVRPHRPALRAQARAELARARGEHDPAAWAEVAEMWDACDRPPHVAYARWREGEAALRAGLGAEAATEPLRAAFALADAMGARPIRQAVLDLAARGRVDLGVDPDATRDRAAASSGLTAREIEVIGLVARGRTNRQIADELFISVKTASVHVSNILMKLDAQNRVEAAARARDLGLVA